METEQLHQRVNRLVGVIALSAVLALHVAPAYAASGPGLPGSTLRACRWNNTIYPHGATRKAAVIVNGQTIRYDIYKCQDGQWIYVGSSDDA